eukprot:jgi/Ulvmu1/10187/UM006_0143.1
MQSATDTLRRLAFVFRGTCIHSVQSSCQQSHRVAANEALHGRLYSTHGTLPWTPPMAAIRAHFAQIHQNHAVSHGLWAPSTTASCYSPRRYIHQSITPLSDSSTKDQSRQPGQQQSIVYHDDEASDISTKITPVSRPEAAGWSVVILAAYSVSAFLLYLVYSQFFVETPETAVFNQALDTVREDFRVTALLGSTIKGYGGEGGRHQRRRISHNSYLDSNQVKHTQVQFFVSGNGKRGVVSADMFQKDGEWQYAYLYVDVSGQRLVLKPLGSFVG